jgi:hypothetical protein
MKGRFDWEVLGQTAKRRKPRRKTVNWLHVNIGEWEAKRLRALADCIGCELRGFLEAAVRAYYRGCEEDLKRECGIRIDEAVKMSRAERREIGSRRQAIRQAALYCGVCCSEKN